MKTPTDSPTVHTRDEADRLARKNTLRNAIASARQSRGALMAGGYVTSDAAFDAATALITQLAKELDELNNP